MQSNVFGFFARRRRYFFLKVLAVCFCFGTLYLWTSSLRHGGDKTPEHIPHIDLGNYQKADNLLDIDSRSKKHQMMPTPDVTGLKLLREKVLKENTDEFLVPVLQDVQYSEVDLDKRRSSEYAHYDAGIEEDLSKVKPELGAGGDRAKLPDDQKELGETIMKKEAFNRLLSEYISPNRTVPDTRERGCLTVDYDKSLPTASVVIIYTNEAFSTLVRTIHSVINRTPPEILKEIVMVDDFSDRWDLQGKLERYLATKFPAGVIRLVRLQARAGLIRARMIGAHLAVGDVLIFLDAHCEATEKWAEPLLQRIKEERTAVVCPIIDVIDDKTMEYYHSNGEFFQIGGFTWSGHFTWINIPSYEKKRKAHHYSPTRSPTMAGGLFAIDRKYFWEIGSYDSGMQLWGGENLEMSFRIWQCGGSVEIIPCSRVGHIFRSFHPYTFPGNVDSHGLNTARLAVSWMDDYQDIFFSYREELKTAKYGDVSDRIQFRKKKNCKSFKWYLDNIYKEKFHMHLDSQVYGQFRNEKTKQCFDNMQHGESDEYQLGVYPCHEQVYSSQTFFLSNNNMLRRENECASASGDTVRMVQCDSSLKSDTWEYKNKQIVSKRADKCITVSKGKDGGYEIVLETCDKSNENQLWTVKKSV